MSTHQLRADERGLVSIIVTVILMLIISITVLSFAQIIRREQREALDNQLSSQAFYAAESGVNDMRNYIKANFVGTAPPDKLSCKNDTPYNNLKPVIDSANDVSYACILLNNSPDSLEYELSPSEPSKVFPITPVGGTPSSFVVSWKPSTSTTPTNGCSTNVNGSNVQPPVSDWSCGYGMIRLDLVPVSAVPNRTTLMNRSYGLFIEPVNTGTVKTISYANGTIGRSAATCNNTICTLRITNLPGDANYYVRASTLYRGTTLSVEALNSSNVALPLKDAQIMIDSTGKAQDVLRRVQVRIPLFYQGLHADNAITSNDSICKNFTAFYNNAESSAINNSYTNTSGC